MTGPDFVAAFDVPVFHVDGAVAVTADEPDPTAALEMPMDEIRRDEHSRIKVSDGPGGREFYFPAARNIGAALFTLVLAIIVDGGVWLAVHYGAPLVFPIVASLVGVLMSCFAFSLWFKSSRVTVNSSGVGVAARYLIFSRTRQFDAGDILRFDTSAGMSVGSHVFMDIRLVPRPGADDEASAADRMRSLPPGQRPPTRFRVSDPRGVCVASTIGSVAEANWLAREMNRALGRRS
jgi:hypothetical protein